MTPQQKLIRLRELTIAIRAAVDKVNSLDEESEQRMFAAIARDGLLTQHEALLSDVHLPPIELSAMRDPETWAALMARHVPGVTEETAYAWLSKAMETSYAAGLVEGTARAHRNATDGRQALIDTLRLVSGMIVDGRIRAPMVRDANDPDNPPIPLLQHLRDVMRSAGENV